MTTQKPIKLLFYTHALYGGGGERLWAALASEFLSKGYEVIFAEDFQSDDNRGALNPAIKVYTLGKNHWKSIRRLKQLLVDEKPDVALSAIGGSNIKLLAARAMSRSPVKTVISYHGFTDWKTGLLSFLTYAGLALWSRAADRTIAVSSEMKETLVSHWFAKESKVLTILNPVYFPRDIEIPSQEQLAARPARILAIGRLVPEKDFMSLIRAFYRLDRKDATLTILGKGPMERQLREKIREFGLTDRVNLPGYANDPWTEYSSAKVFVSSAVSESFGNVSVEALAHGLPVVAVASTGPSQILANGKFGRLVAPGDTKALADAINDALDNPGDPRKSADRAQLYSMDVRARIYEELIHELVADNRQSADIPAKVNPSPDSIGT